MSAKNKLSNILTSKTAAHSGKFPFPRTQAQEKMRHNNKFVTEQRQLHQNESIIMQDRIKYSRKNYTENSKYIGRSVATIDVNHRLAEQRRYSFSNNSKSLNLKTNKYLFKQVNKDKIEDNRQNKLSMMRQQKLVRLKEMYSLKNKMKGEPRSVANSIHRIGSNSKFNSIGNDNKHNSLITKKNRQRQEAIFHKHEPFINTKQIKQSQRNLPKFLDYCQQNDRKQSKSHFQSKNEEKQMPETLNKDHIINKVNSLKAFIESPPYLPVTFKKQQTNFIDNLTIDWVKNSYEPYLDIFQEVSLDNFIMKKFDKGVYYGQQNKKTELMEGRAIIFYENGKIYEGYLKDNKKQGLGYELYLDKSFYYGSFVAGKRDGKGKFQWSNGQIYDGQWKNNKKEGSGIWKGSNNLSYFGQWKNDVINGFGVLIESKTRYEGEFKNFMKQGKGTIRFQNDETYTGMFKNNLLNGVGDYYWNNRDHYHGEFVNGKRHGQGAIQYSNGGIYRGLFQNDKKSGQGEQQYEDNLLYEGQFQNDLRHGWGILSCDGKVLFEGYWLNNSAIDPSTKKIDTIIEEQQSNYERDASKRSKIKKNESNISLARNKIIAKKQNKIKLQHSLNRQKTKNHSEQKPFQRACNCERHRKKILANQT